MIRPTLIFVVITVDDRRPADLHRAEAVRRVDAGGIGGADRQFQTIVLYLYELAFPRRDFGEAAAIAWMLFLHHRR